MMRLSRAYVDWAHGPCAEDGEVAAVALLAAVKQARGTTFEVELTPEIRAELVDVAQLWAFGGHDNGAWITRYARRLLQRLGAGEYRLPQEVR